jgi:hypothetical protein
MLKLSFQNVHEFLFSNKANYCCYYYTQTQSVNEKYLVKLNLSLCWHNFYTQLSVLAEVNTNMLHSVLLSVLIQHHIKTQYTVYDLLCIHSYIPTSHKPAIMSSCNPTFFFIVWFIMIY